MTAAVKDRPDQSSEERTLPDVTAALKSQSPHTSLRQVRDKYTGLVLFCTGGVMMFLGTTFARKMTYGSLALGQVLIAAIISMVLIISLSVLVDRRGVANKAFKNYEKTVNEDAGIPQEMAQGMPQEAYGKQDVIRLCRVLYDVDDTFVPEWDKFSYDDDGNLNEYGFRSLKPGSLSTDSKQSRIYASLKSVLGTGWNISLEPTTDTIFAKRGSDIPSLVSTKNLPVVATSPEHAAEIYDDLTIYIGEGTDGPIGFMPKKVPHKEFVGATGGGKSVAVRSELGQFHAAGFRFFIGDGKGTDYAPYSRVPNFVAIGTTPSEYISVVHQVYQILETRRRVFGAAAKKGDVSWRRTVQPILLVMDEFADTRKQWLARADELKDKTAKNLIDKEIQSLLKVGREFRVHVFLATQDMYAETVETSWQDNFKVVQSLGKPGGMTVKKAFPEGLHGEVTRVGESISPNDRGRGLVAVADQDTGVMKVELYQSYYDYTPAEDINAAPGPVKDLWKAYKSGVSDKVRKMYPRQWVQLEYPEPKDGAKDPYADFRDSGWVDFDKLKVEDIHRLKTIYLDDPETLEPIPEREIYDPLSDKYIGIEPEGSMADGGDILI